MKTFATVLFAICVCSQLALSADLNDLKDAIIEIGNKLDAKERAKFSMVSPTINQIIKVPPQEILASVVHSTEHHWERVKRLLEIETPNASKDAFVVKKDRDDAFVRDITKNVKDELSQWTAALLSATRNEDERLEIFNRRMLFIDENKNNIHGFHTDSYVFWDKYSLSEIATCINDAHEKLMKECFVNGKITERCAVYYFACGFQLHNHRNFYWVVGVSKIFLERAET
jgi:hypothetical protein